MFKLKTGIISFVVILLVLTAGFCAVQPKIHKEFQFNIVEYLIKINVDGSMSTTKSVTTTNIIKGNSK